MNLAISPRAKSAGDRGANGLRPVVLSEILLGDTEVLLCWVGRTGTSTERNPNDGGGANLSESKSK